MKSDNGYRELQNVLPDEQIVSQQSKRDQTPESTSFKIGKWWNWMIMDTIKLTNSEGRVFATCSRTNLSWSDYLRFVTDDNIDVVDFLSAKLTALKNVYIPVGIENQVWMALQQDADKLSKATSIELIRYYLELLVKKLDFNEFDLGLAGTFLNGASIMTTDGVYRRVRHISTMNA